MPKLKTYDLFISHARAYNDAYYRLEGLLKAENVKLNRIYTASPKSIERGNI